MASMLREYRDILMGSHRNVRLFFLAAFLSQLSGGFFGILYNLYIKSLGLPDTVAGSYVSAGALASTLSLVPAGMISDRFGRKKAVLTAGFLTIVLSLIQAFLHTPWLMVCGSFASGMVGSVIWVSILPLLAENTEKEERFHLFSINFGIGLVAQVLGSVLAGTVAQVAGHWMSPVLALRVTLVIGAAIGFASLGPFSKIQDTVRPGLANNKRPRLSDSWTRLKHDKRQMVLIVQFSLASTLIGFGAGLVIPYLNLYFSERFAMTKAGIGIVIGLAQACTALAMFVGPTMAKRFGPVKAAVGFQLSSIPFLLATAFATNLWFASGAVVVRNALMNCASPIQDSIMMALVNEEVRGLAVSCGQTLWSMGWAIMGPISTHIVGTYGAYTGYAIVFCGTAALYLIGSTYYLLTFGKHESQVYSQQQAETVSV